MPLSLNQAIFLSVSAGQHPAVGTLALAIIVANWALYGAPLLLIYLWLWGETADRCAAVSATLAALVALAVAALISAQYMHARPFMDGLSPNWLDHPPDSSFPSDHATLLFALAVALFLKPPPIMAKAYLLLLVLACAVSFARVWLGAHYPWDIGGGAALGCVAAWLALSPPFCALVSRLTDFGIWLYGWPQRMFTK